ncbi:MAG: hypothetical protein HQL24_09750 [Candidatus Omnitrophica bacterium]|nr:hypothetical protein [Candidatus Omnitrophota bacterium]
MNKERKNLLVFGYGLAVILTFIAVRLWMKHGLSLNKVVLLGAAAVFCLLTSINVELIKPVYTNWMKVAHVIGNVVTGLMLTIIFYLVFTPVGIFMKLTGKDPLQEKIDKQAETYWKKKTVGSENPDRYKQQF